MAVSAEMISDHEAERAATAAAQVLDAVDSVVLGQPAATRECLAAIAARGHVLIEGVPGTAKTLLVRAFARALGLTFRRVQFTPDLMPSDVTGVSVLTRQNDFEFRPGPLFGDLVLADEINRAPAKTQAALLEAMQERQVTVDGTAHELPSGFTVFATQNPVEFEGTYPLPEAELDRFLVKVAIDYPERATETGILARVVEGFESDEPETFGIASVMDAAAVKLLRQQVRRVRAEPALLGYIADLVRATRQTASLTLGASPRASIALLKLAQAMALLEGRTFAIPDDVKRLAPAVLRHRVIVAPELELEGVSADSAIAALLERVDVPHS